MKEREEVTRLEIAHLERQLNAEEEERRRAQQSMRQQVRPSAPLLFLPFLFPSVISSRPVAPSLGGSHPLKSPAFLLRRLAPPTGGRVGRPEG